MFPRPSRRYENGNDKRRVYPEAWARHFDVRNYYWIGVGDVAFYFEREKRPGQPDAERLAVIVSANVVRNCRARRNMCRLFVSLPPTVLNLGMRNARNPSAPNFAQKPSETLTRTRVTYIRVTISRRKTNSYGRRSTASSSIYNTCAYMYTRTGQARTQNTRRSLTVRPPSSPGPSMRPRRCSPVRIPRDSVDF